MLTYTFTQENSGPLYEQLYRAVRADILSGRLSAGDRLPSKRSFSENLGVSSITVEGAYNRLIDEGFVVSEPKRGYYVAPLQNTVLPSEPVSPLILCPPQSGEAFSVDLSASRGPNQSFPFSVWTHLLRETIREQGDELLTPSPCSGIRPLRAAIAEHLQSFRGMRVDPDQIILGAGTEYLYGLLIQLLGAERIYCLEDPGYQKISQIYLSYRAVCRWAEMDDSGVTIAGLDAAKAEVAHISPTHHFPSGITMPVSRRCELLAWAGSKPDRYIIEDDYDSEFRLTGHPVPSLQSIDTAGRVIYMNTFSKTLASTVRISYMVLPPKLANAYYRRLSFYSCTVSTFEQYTLARFLSDGYFEKHINRRRLAYTRLRRQLLQAIVSSPVSDRLRVLERDSGLHFLLEIKSNRSDDALLQALRERGVHLLPLSAYYHRQDLAPAHTFIIQYSSLSLQEMEQALQILEELLGKETA